jgi:hypothetical protein
MWAALRRTPGIRFARALSCHFAADGWEKLPELAQWLYRDEETMRARVHALNEAGLRWLERATIPGRPT